MKASVKELLAGLDCNNVQEVTEKIVALGISAANDLRPLAAACLEFAVDQHDLGALMALLRELRERCHEFHRPFGKRQTLRGELLEVCQSSYEKAVYSRLK